MEKKNKINPKTLALKLKDIFLAKINNFSEIDIAGPGFLNIKLSKSALLNNINSILNNNKNYGSKKVMKLIILNLFLLIQLVQCM